jgi:uncharacterized protein YjbI with pentapeptide repeats
MANDHHLEALRAGVFEWNAWRSSRPDVKPDFVGADLTGLDMSALNAPDASGADVVVNVDVEIIRPDLRGADFSFALLNEAKLVGANLDDAVFTGTQLVGADLSLVYAHRAIFDRSHLRKAMIRHAILFRAHLSGSDLRDSDLTRTDISHAEASGTWFKNAILRETAAHGTAFQGAILDSVDFTYASCTNADFTSAKLRRAILRGTNLEAARLVSADLSGATLNECAVYGVAAWDLKLDGTVQSDLIITKDPLFSETVVTVDDIQIAHFLYLLIENPHIRKVIDSVSSKVVLILGRFAPARKSVLDAVREELKHLGFVPVLFDFDKPRNRDLTETVSTIAHLSRFILVDLTEAKSVPQELSAIIPFLPSVPVQPIVAQGEGIYSMFEHFRAYPWVLTDYVYPNTLELIRQLGFQIIPTVEKHLAAAKTDR